MPRCLPAVILAVVPAFAFAEDRWPLPPDAIARVGSTRLRQGHRIQAMAFAPDGATVAAIDGQGNVCLWDATTGELRRHFAIEVGRWSWDGELHYGADGNTLLLTNDNSFIRYDARTGRRLPSAVERGLYVAFTTCSHDGKMAALGTREHFIQLIDTETGDEIRRIKPAHSPGGWRSSAAFSADGKTLFVVDEKARAITVYDIATGVAKAVIPFPNGNPESILSSPDGRSVAVVSHLGANNNWDYALTLGDLARGTWRTLESKIHRPQLAFAVHGRQLITEMNGIGLRIYDVNTGTKIVRPELPYSPLSFAVAPDGRTFASSDWEGRIHVHDLESGAKKLVPGAPVGNLNVEFTEAGHLLIEAATTSTWDWKTGRELDRVPGIGCLSPDRRIRATQVFGRIVVTDVLTGRILRILRPDDAKGPQPLLFSADGRTLMAGDRSITAFDVATGRRLYGLNIPTEPFHSFYWYGRHRAAGGNLAGITSRVGDAARIQFWDVRTGSQKAAPEMKLPDAQTLLLSPDGTKAAAIAPHQQSHSLHAQSPEFFTDSVYVWDVATGRGLRKLAVDYRRITSLKFSPDGRTLAIGNDVLEGTRTAHGWQLNLSREDRNEIWLWEITSGRERRNLRGHQVRIESLAFSPEGRYLASASQDAPVYIWDIYASKSREPLPPADQVWRELGGDAESAFDTVKRLIAQPREAMAILSPRLKPSTKIDAAHVERLLRDLNDAAFAKRDTAFAELARYGDAIEPQLRQALAAALGVESARRLSDLLDALTQPSIHDVRHTRALEVLEQIADAEAKRLIADLAAGEATAALTREARATLRRLERTPSHD